MTLDHSAQERVIPTCAELDHLEQLARAATPGPYDHMRGRGLVRAIRDDLAIPLFEALQPYGDPVEAAPTCRVGKEVVFRANSTAARDSAEMKRQWRNGEYAAALDPAAVLRLIAAARRSVAATDLEKALRDILPAVEAHLMTGDALAKGAKNRVWRSPIKNARAALAKATTAAQSATGGDGDAASVGVKPLHARACGRET